MRQEVIPEISFTIIIHNTVIQTDIVIIVLGNNIFIFSFASLKVLCSFRVSHPVGLNKGGSHHLLTLYEILAENQESWFKG